MTLNLNADHSAYIRMEQADIRAGINQRDYILVSLAIMSIVKTLQFARIIAPLERACKGHLRILLRDG